MADFEISTLKVCKKHTAPYYTQNCNAKFSFMKMERN